MRWQSLGIFPTLHANQIHIWRAPLIRAEKELIELKSFLNKEEQERASKFIVERAANSFVVARGFLRKLLSKYLQISPQDLIFQQNRYGKPYLDFSPLQFNLSHSHDLALFIFAKNISVGVDVELIREDYDFVDIAEKFFSKAESTELLSLPKNEQVRAFFNCWTCKEAFIKAKGMGMFHALDKFSVEITGARFGRMGLKDGDDKLESDNWVLEAIDLGNKYAGAFAVDVSNYLVDFYDI
jgi:4'-phosphopantetheinyl transferase